MNSRKITDQFSPWLLITATMLMMLILTKVLPLSGGISESLWIFLFFLFTVFWSVFHRFFRWSIFFPETSAFQLQIQLSHLAHGVFFISCSISVLSSSLEMCFPEVGWLNVIGLLMLLDAIILTSISQYLFSKCFRASNNSPILITNGIYRLNRHPYYLGLFELSLSCSLIFHSYVGITGSLLLWVILFFLVRQEEKLLIDLFNDEYRSYRQSTPGLLVIK